MGSSSCAPHRVPTSQPDDDGTNGILAQTAHTVQPMSSSRCARTVAKSAHVSAGRRPRTSDKTQRAAAPQRDSFHLQFPFFSPARFALRRKFERGGIAWAIPMRTTATTSTTKGSHEPCTPAFRVFLKTAAPLEGRLTHLEHAAIVGTTMAEADTHPRVATKPSHFPVDPPPTAFPTCVPVFEKNCGERERPSRRDARRRDGTRRDATRPRIRNDRTPLSRLESPPFGTVTPPAA